MLSQEVFEPDNEIIQILSDDPLTYVKTYLEGRIVGEGANKLALFLSKLTYLTENPTHELIQGESGVGKTHLALGVLDAFPPEDVIKLSRITGTWTDYAAKDLKHKIILLQQLGGLSSSSDTFHILMSERGLSLGTVKREGGEWRSEKIEAEGPISLTSTTTSMKLDARALDGCYEGDEEKRNLSGDVCPYSTPLKGFKVLRGCLLQRRELTGPSGHTEYLVRCTSSGYIKHYRTCPEYVDAKRDGIDPEELRKGLTQR